MTFDNLSDSAKKYILLAPKKFATVTMQSCAIMMKNCDAKNAAIYLSNAAFILDLCAKSLQQTDNKVLDFKKRY